MPMLVAFSPDVVFRWMTIQQRERERRKRKEEEDTLDGVVGGVPSTLF
jgi:hypothetical protein